MPHLNSRPRSARFWTRHPLPNHDTNRLCSSGLADRFLSADLRILRFCSAASRRMAPSSFCARRRLWPDCRAEKAVLRAKALAANVMGIRSFAALSKTSGAFAR